MRMMAASGLNTIRVRVYFDYPPPAVPDCRMCWVLVDLNKCRVVADLASIIKEKFDFSRRTILNLFIEDCYLPPTESVYVVRDNDSIRVKVEGVPQVNGFESSRNSDSLPCKAKKRDREADEEAAENSVKKRKKRKEESPEVESQPAEKKTKKKRKKEKQGIPVKQITPAKVPTLSKTKQETTAKKPSAPSTSAQSKAAKQSTSSSGTSDSSEEEPPKKPSAVSAPSRPAAGGLVKAVVPPPAAAAAAASSSDSSSDSSPSPTPPPKRTVPTTGASSAPSAPPVVKKAQEKPKSSSSDSDSSSEAELVIKRPGLGQRVGLGVATNSIQPGGVAGRGRENVRGGGRGSSPGRGMGRGIGRGDGRPPWRGSSPRGGPRGGHSWGRGSMANRNFHYSDQNGLQQHLNDTLTNKTVVLQNPPESIPKRDYAAMPLLAAPPQVGQKIAFKLLELTENYTPEVSDYKEGKIVSFNPSTNQIELELLTSKPAPVEPGKFDLVYQTPDGSEIVEYAVSRGSQLTERWESLLEPRLIVESVG
ncbi:coilin [Megalops cyprinoides]|uniref:coilin n=1 Tax=Megalops cyprinoides TaxID=118141 RepID=UPI0018649C36|nr:coilin [Megalops cyprinoides]